MCAGRRKKEHYARPTTRQDCEDSARPCPWVSCRYHLYLDVNSETGTIKVNFPTVELWELPYSCALDLADERELTFEEIGQALNLTRERIRQLTGDILSKVHHRLFPDDPDDRPPAASP